MKKILFVCSMGMSSAIAVNALKEEAKKRNIKLEVKSTGANVIENELLDNTYDLVMVAPQIKHRFVDIVPVAKEHGIPCVMIQPRSYGPLGGPFLLKQIKDEIGLERWN